MRLQSRVRRPSSATSVASRKRRRRSLCSPPWASWLETALDRARTKRLGAGRAPKPLFKFRPAGAVAENDARLTAGEPTIAPPHQCDEGRRELETHFGQLVLVTRRVFLVGNPGQDATVYQLGEAIGQHWPSDAELTPQFLEAMESAKYVANDEHRPAVTDEIKRPADGVERPKRGAGHA